MRESAVHKIKTKGGNTILIDEEDLEKLPKVYGWTLNDFNRAKRAYPVSTSKVKGKHIYLHVVLFGRLGSHRIMRHKNGNPLDFRKSNVVIAARVENFGPLSWSRNPHRTIPLQFGGKIRCNSCVLTRAPEMTRCERYDDCKNAHICLDIVSHNTGWPGWTAEKCNDGAKEACPA